MKNARIFFAKSGPCKYISHLDLNRVMLRAVSKSGVDVWRTEGFNQHAYITFALPLSLGYASTCESMDFRLNNDDEDMTAVPERLNACLPEGLRVLRCAEAVHKPAAIVSASYDISLEPMNEGEISTEELSAKLTEFLAQPEIIVPKKTKKGMKDVDLKGYILACDVIPSDQAPLSKGSCRQGRLRDIQIDRADRRVTDEVRFTLTLPAGGELNINPSLFTGALAGYCGVELYADVTRSGIYMEGGEPFE